MSGKPVTYNLISSTRKGLTLSAIQLDAENGVTYRSDLDRASLGR